MAELKNLFGDDVKIKDIEKKHVADPSGNSKNFSTFFSFKSIDDYIFVAVYDWSEKLNYENGYPDNLKVSIIGAEFSDFLENVQYK